MASNSSAAFVIGSSLPSTQAQYYDRLAVRALFAHLGFQGLTAERQIPMNAGRTTNIYTYNLSPYTASVSANSADTPPPTATEGTVGNPIIPTEATIAAVLGQYVDFTNVSDFALAVDIGKPLEQLSEMLGYRGALVVDTLIQQAFDAAVSTDATCSIQIPDGSFMTRAVINTSVATIRGKNGRPFAGGRMRGIMHPYALSDAANDKTINGLLDVLKHSADGQKSIEDGLVRDNEIRTIEGVDFVMSTNVPLVSGAPVSGKSSYATYITADEMMFSIALGGFEDVPDESNFKANIYEFSPTAFDPGGEIGGAVSYNFKFVVSPRPAASGTFLPFRRILSETAVS
jgi:N4-gp56 family major capsid protein